MEDISESRRGNLFLGASTIPGQYLIPLYLKDFKDRFPNVTITMKVADTESIINQVAEREIDVGIVGAWIPNRKVDCFPWKEDELVVLVPKEHRLAGRVKVDFKDLTGEKWVFREKGSGTRIVTEEILAQLGINKDSLNIQVELGSTEAVVAAVEAGMGIAMVSSHVARQCTRNDELQLLTITGGTAKRDIFVVYPKQKHRRKTVDNFLDYLRSLRDHK